jgi:regulator of protease activity HflC (stomatin/prohibitin superfamily)
LGIITEQVLLRNVVIPEKIQASIQEKLAAEQETQKLDFELEKARKEAERKKIEARGNAEAQSLLSKGLTEQVLKLKAIEATQKLAESPNSKVIIIGGGKDNMPILLQDK